MLLDENKAPRGESRNHYELKQISKYLARQKGCCIIAEEVTGFADKTISNKKGIVDVAGIKIINKKYSELPEIITYGFEAKSSLSDFKNGFNAGANYTYIIAPKGIIDKSLIPLNIGFYEVDLNNYKIGFNEILYGIELIKKPQKRHVRKHYKTLFMSMKAVATRATNQDIFSNPKITIEEKKRKRRK